MADGSLFLSHPPTVTQQQGLVLTGLDLQDINTKIQNATHLGPGHGGSIVAVVVTMGPECIAVNHGQQHGQDQGNGKCHGML